MHLLLNILQMLLKLTGGLLRSRKKFNNLNVGSNKFFQGSCITPNTICNLLFLIFILSNPLASTLLRHARGIQVGTHVLAANCLPEAFETYQRFAYTEVEQLKGREQPNLPRKLHKSSYHM